VAVNECFSFACPLEWCCSCGGFVLDSVGCVCVCVCVCVCGGCGDACRVGRSVVAGLVVRSGVGVVFSVRSSGGMARGVPIAAWCGILDVNEVK
jgi:hypothetical protein